jgi:hypothetical protein
MVNASPVDLVFEVQNGRAADWRLVADTGIESPNDFADQGAEASLGSPGYLVCARSVVILCRGMRRPGV